ncbi:hypothetical protein ACEXOS_011390 [Herbiconiux sp. P16]|uniref:hypothetical protein n=1 Tax=Herbiconiux wuyangfengii TaxID=3342794 RepID=UPI0035BB3DEB
MDNEPRRYGADQSEPAYGIRTTAAAGASAPAAAQTPALTEPAFAEPAAPVGASILTRVLGYVIALLLGALFGVLGTIVHQISFSVFGLFDVPIGLIIALPAETLLLVGLRMSFASRLASILAGVGLVGMVALLALPSPGGSILIPGSVAGSENVLGTAWLIGSTLVAVVVLAWPRLGGARPATK